MISSQQLVLPLYENDFFIRRSGRAKYLRINITSVGQVEVVVPKRVSPQQVHEFIRQKQSWIEQTRQQIKSQRGGELDSHMPSSIYLRAVDQTWQIRYQPGQNKPLRHKAIDAGTGQLAISYVAQSEVAGRLSHWLSGKARSILIPWLNAVSEETGLPYNKVAVRGQKTRWGSCSSRHNINLNRCLLFLQPELVRYLMVHELCHTRHMNHSRRFWALVEKFVPDYQERERQINNATYQIPGWALRG
jgi:predicted metal-dependent hydrolase